MIPELPLTLVQALERRLVSATAVATSASAVLERLADTRERETAVRETTLRESAARDAVLGTFAEHVVQLLVTLGSPGCAFLDLAPLDTAGVV